MYTDKLKYKELTHLIIKSFHDVYNYLKAAAVEVGLLMNFGNEPMFKLLVYNKQQKQSV
jgi:hypothetical protein